MRGYNEGRLLCFPDGVLLGVGQGLVPLQGPLTLLQGPAHRSGK